MSNPNVPTINLETAFSDDNQLQLIDSACRDHGFFLIKNHGIQALIISSFKKKLGVSKFD